MTAVSHAISPIDRLSAFSTATLLCCNAVIRYDHVCNMTAWQHGWLVAGDKVNNKSGVDMRATMSRSTLSRSTRRPATTAGSKRTLHPAGSVFQSTVRPDSGFATQRRPTQLKFDPDADLPDQVQHYVP